MKTDKTYNIMKRTYDVILMDKDMRIKQLEGYVAYQEAQLQQYRKTLQNMDKKVEEQQQVINNNILFYDWVMKNKPEVVHAYLERKE